MKNITIYEYLDFRLYLADLYQQMRERHPHFTHRYIAGEVGFDSGYFSRILKGTRTCTPQYTERFITLLGLRKVEAEYFRELVSFTQAKSHSEKQRRLEELNRLRRPIAHKLEPRQFEYTRKWYYVAIRELLGCGDFTLHDTSRIAALIRPAITAREARKALHVLRRAELIYEDQNGVLKRKKRVWTGDEGDSIAFAGFHRQGLSLADKAFDNAPHAERSMSSLTLSVSEDSYEAIQKEIAAFRKKLLNLAYQTLKPDRVIHCSLNAFPMSEVVENRENENKESHE